MPSSAPNVTALTAAIAGLVGYVGIPAVGVLLLLVWAR